MAACFKCGEAIPQGPDMALDAVCSKCSSYLHSCANCQFYDEYQKNPCRQAQAAFVHDRLTKNACTLFAVKSAGPIGGALVDEPRKGRFPRPARAGGGGGGGGFKRSGGQRDAHLNKNAPIMPSQNKNGGGSHGGGAGSGGGNSSDAKKKLESLFTI